jgi:CheY-like chemotaxis protein
MRTMIHETQKIILVIDDSIDGQNLLRVVLEAKGYKTYTAPNGSEALVLLSELTVLPDLILLDAQMPVMDGYGFRARQRLIPRLKHIPVVVMSGDEDLSMSVNMDHPEHIVIKPINIKKLVESIHLLV